MKKIPSLDGVRALAITLVIGVHLAQHNDNRPLHILFDGQDGVGLFFILSGFLVTTLMLKEHDRDGKINIARFYFRRAARILPPLLGYLALLVSIGTVLHTQLSRAALASVLFFYHNMSQAGNWTIEHTWSLAVEEQFYILWPLVLVGALRWGRKGVSLACAVLIALAPILRVLGYVLKWGWMHHGMSFLLPTRMDALLCGCLVASAVGNRRFEAAYSRVKGMYALGFLFLFGLSPWLTVHEGQRYLATAGYTLESIVGAFAVLWLSRNAEHVLGRIANAKPVAKLGVMSYSVYLWQTLGTHYAHGLGRALLGLGFIGLTAWLSHNYIEQPALTARGWVEARWLSRSIRPVLVAGD